MTNDSNITAGWLAILFLCALGLAMAVSATVHADTPTLTDRIALVVPSLASRRDEPVDAQELASAIASVTDSPQWAALLLTTAAHESSLSARIARSDCREHECDHGRAWGLWQAWVGPHNAAVWGSSDIAVQAKEASHTARQAYNLCRNSGVPFPLSTIRAYAGRGCLGKLKGEEARIQTYARVLRRIQ